MGKIVYLHGQPPIPVSSHEGPYPTGTPNIFTPDDDVTPAPELAHLGPDYLHTYIRDRDVLMFRGFAIEQQEKTRGVPPLQDLKGIKEFTGAPIFLFMQAVWSNDLKRAVELINLFKTSVTQKLNQPHFFYMTGYKDVCFVTPAHLCRTLTMAHYLNEHLKARFDIPDSEGALPQHYWARYAYDGGLFAYGEYYLGMDMSSYTPQGVTPIWEAVDAENPVGAKGLGLCGSQSINAPRPADYARLTPLMALTARALYEPTARHLRAMFNLARAPHVAWDRTDWENHTVMDLAGPSPRLRFLLAKARTMPLHPA